MKNAATNCIFISAKQTKLARRRTGRLDFFPLFIFLSCSTYNYFKKWFLKWHKCVFFLESNDADCSGTVSASRSQQMWFWYANDIHPQPTEGAVVFLCIIVFCGVYIRSYWRSRREGLWCFKGPSIKLRKFSNLLVSTAFNQNPPISSSSGVVNYGLRPWIIAAPPCDLQPQTSALHNRLVIPFRPSVFPSFCLASAASIPAK